MASGDLLSLVSGSQKVREDETLPGSLQTQRVSCVKKIPDAHGQSSAPIHEKGHLDLKDAYFQVPILKAHRKSIRVPVSVIPLHPSPAHLFEVCGGSAGAVQTSRKEDSFLSRRSADSEPLRGCGQNGHHDSDRTLRSFGPRHQLGE